jgi:hypothetical protein
LQENLLSANSFVSAVESGNAVREKLLAELSRLSQDELVLLAQNPDDEGPIALEPKDRSPANSATSSYRR